MNNYDDGHGDILRHLRNRNNPYIRSNMIANLPKLNDSPPNANNNNSNDNDSNNNNHNRHRRNRGNIQSLPVSPSTTRITQPLEIVLLNGKTRTERSRGTTISCERDPYSIMNKLKDILRCEKILTSLDHFIFGYCVTEKGKFQSIYDYQINNIDFKKRFDHFVLQQVSETPTEPTTTTTSTTKAYNKKVYEERNNAMVEAEVILRKELDFEDFKMLRKNRKILAKYKYDMGVLGRSFEDIGDELFADLDNLKEKENGGKKRRRKRRKYSSDSESDGYDRRRKRRKRSPSPSRNNKENNQMNDMMNIMKMKMMMDCFMNPTKAPTSTVPPSIPPPVSPTVSQRILPPLPAPATEPRQIATNLTELTKTLLQRGFD